MKALEYLYRMKQANYEMGYEPKNLLEAIAELEQLQNRSCESCRYWNSKYSIDNNAECDKLFNFRCYGDFYCKYYEKRREDDTTK